MIYITGDCHGDYTKIFNLKNKLNKNDYIIVTGDFGYWDKSQDKIYNKMEKLPFTILFVDGNHECMNKKTDVLTEFGWINIEKLYYSNKPIKIANLNLNNKCIYYDYPINKIKNISNKIIDIIGKNYKQSVTPNHDVIIDGKKVKAKELLNKEIYEEQLKININTKNNSKIEINNNIIEILTTIVMDATIVDYSKKNPNSKKIRIQYHLKKEKKIQYILEILDKENIHYTKRFGKNNDIYICIHGEDGRKLYSLLEWKKELPYYFTKMNKEQFEHLTYALSKTDGTKVNNNIIWRTTSLNDVNIIQELCVKHNYDMYSSKINNGSGYKINCKPQYHCSLGYNKNIHRKLQIIEKEYNDSVYCFTMKNGTLITRYNGAISITGNCFDMLNELPIKKWNTGYVHYIRKNIIHLMRGQIYTIENKTFFTFGGAHSIDKMYRIEGKSWWKEELPNDWEIQIALDNLELINNKVDYIITHDCSKTILHKINIHFKSNIVNTFLEMLEQEVDFNKWYFGHHHVDENIDNKHICLYNDIIEL